MMDTILNITSYTGPNVSTEQYLSTHNQVLVQMKTEGSVSGKGFNLQYRIG